MGSYSRLTRLALVACLLLLSACTKGDGLLTQDPVAGAPDDAPTATPSPDRESPPPPVERLPAVSPAEWVVGPSVHKVFLTFEGRPRKDALAKVLRILEARPARVAFFLPGAWAAGHRSEIAALADSGQVVGNRGYGYRNFTTLSKKEIRSSLRKAEKVWRSNGIEVEPFIRPPGGARDRSVLEAAGSLGYRSVHWTYRGEASMAGGLATKTMEHVSPGAIISLDLWRESHVNGLPNLLRRLEKNKWSTAPLQKLRNARPVRLDLEIGPGFEGPVVAYLQKRLAAATFPAGEPDGKYGAMTVHAVYAFQKVHGLERDAVVSPEEMEMIATLEPPDPPRQDSGSYIDIDLTRQVLFEVQGGRVINTFPISTGNGATYESQGDLRIASTPRGDFAFDRKIPGWRTSDLGQLYYPSYFYGGYAVHGSSSVPPYPASHGCVRIPMHVAAEFYERNLVGTPVYVHD